MNVIYCSPSLIQTMGAISMAPDTESLKLYAKRGLEVIPSGDGACALPPLSRVCVCRPMCLTAMGYLHQFP